MYRYRKQSKIAQQTDLTDAPTVPLYVVAGELPAVLAAEEVDPGVAVHHSAARRVGAQFCWLSDGERRFYFLFFKSIFCIVFLFAGALSTAGESKNETVTVCPEVRKIPVLKYD